MKYRQRLAYSRKERSEKQIQYNPQCLNNDEEIRKKYQITLNKNIKISKDQFRLLGPFGDNKNQLTVKER